MNIQYNTGANVSMNTAIANPANTQAQALCNGGSSTGPHQHWSLKQNGSFYHLTARTCRAIASPRPAAATTPIAIAFI
ncbi:hypothetical protein J5226_25275 [Lysobacter sp. K5869]|uniref:hypothetical protein n=1 Tax=Lysobacter sp. K5869 TaxID=2820808 RepID=UPI001C05F82A|nr:hypothetical protein [Lysobacter sp. K5869]QWP76836.1 hypothetical protein J5226_25275 [Lysobacter sp. K5869]